jgi:hypothetical protein
MDSKLMEFFNRQPRMGTLSTADREGNVNAAVFGSPGLLDDRTMVMAIGNNRSFRNLQENPKAVFTIVQPADSFLDWKGVRVYLKMAGCHTSGDILDETRAQIAQVLGEDGAQAAVEFALTFEVTDVRPLIDMGQSYETSI